VADVFVDLIAVESVVCDSERSAMLAVPFSDSSAVLIVETSVPDTVPACLSVVVVGLLFASKWHAIRYRMMTKTKLQLKEYKCRFVPATRPARLKSTFGLEEGRGGG
jgi:hypothetical protein